MSTSAIDDILERIARLPNAERAQLETQLLCRAEAEWSHESETARRDALKRGIDQDAIDEAIEQSRRGGALPGDR